MSKYQEALNRIVENNCPKKTNCQSCEISNRCNCLMKDEVDKLQELVDRATPKNPIEHHYEDVGEEPYIKCNCPNCSVERQLHGYMRFCPYCGQAIDWSDEE